PVCDESHEAPASIQHQQRVNQENRKARNNMLARTASIPYWEDGAGFFGTKYMEGDDSLEGFLSTPHTLSMRTARELEGVMRLLSLSEAASILDCPCGYGRHSIPLAKKGFEVIGSDINREMLDAARR